MYRFVRQCGTGEIIVDFGCGCGAYSRYCRETSGATVVAVDWSYTALRSLAHEKTPGIFTVCADLTALPFRNGWADGLFSVDVLGHIRDQDRSLDEIERICKKSARFFLHAECADYRTRWPDREVLRRTGEDLTAKRDGHVGIRRSSVVETACRRRFAVERFYSPAGMTGWLTGYPDKYAAVLWKANMPCAAATAGIMALIKKLPGTGGLLRVVNGTLNRIELLLHCEGGGSCFAAGRTLPAPPCGEGTSSQQGVDIVIPTLNRPAAVDRLVTALLPQCGKDDRVIVVWQGRRTPIVHGDPRVLYVHHTAPSLPAARNAGIAAGDNPVVAFLDDDCEIDGGFLDALRRCYAETGCEGVAGFVDDPLFTAEGEEPSLFNIENGDIRQHFNHHTDGPAITVMGANMSFTRTALLRTGGFDTNYRRNAIWEDVDMSFRMLGAGVALQFCSSVKVKHLRTSKGGCRADHGARYLFHYFANTVYFACTWAPWRYRRKWVGYWWYRLEYMTRKENVTAASRWRRYHLFALAAAGAGVVAGVTRYYLNGRRRVMPATVVKTSRRYFGGGA